MKKIILTCSAVLMSMSLAACGNSSSHHDDKSSSARSEKVSKKSSSKSSNKSSSSSKSSSSVSPVTSSSTMASKPSQNMQSQLTNNNQQNSQGQTINQSGMTEDEARAKLGGTNEYMKAEKTQNGWAFYDPSNPNDKYIVNNNGQVIAPADAFKDIQS